MCRIIPQRNSELGSSAGKIKTDIIGGESTLTVNHRQLIELGLSYKGTSLRYPFSVVSDLPVLYVRDKMFALLFNRDGIESVNLKTSSDEAWLQRETYRGSVFPGYHMNKQHWNTVILNGTVPDEVIIVMFRESYNRVVAKLSKRERDLLLLN